MLKCSSSSRWNNNVIECKHNPDSEIDITSEEENDVFASQSIQIRDLQMMKISEDELSDGEHQYYYYGTISTWENSRT